VGDAALSRPEEVVGRAVVVHFPSCSTAARTGSADTRINPVYGEYSSRIRRTAPEAHEHQRQPPDDDHQQRPRERRAALLVREPAGLIDLSQELERLLPGGTLCVVLR